MNYLILVFHKNILIHKEWYFHSVILIAWLINVTELQIQVNSLNFIYVFIVM